jgi:hypothetical protein
MTAAINSGDAVNPDNHPTWHHLDVRDCQGTLWAFVALYEGRGRASFEGNLADLALDRLEGSSPEETAHLPRQTASPVLDFVVVPLSASNIERLKETLSGPGILGRGGSVIHVQIEADGERVFMACDHFHRDCTAAAASVPTEHLVKLKARGILRGFHAD